MNGHTEKIRGKELLPRDARFECITSKLAHDETRYYNQFAYKVFADGKVHHFMVTEITFKNCSAAKTIRADKMPKDKWMWI